MSMALRFVLRSFLVAIISAASACDTSALPQGDGGSDLSVMVDAAPDLAMPDAQPADLAIGPDLQGTCHSDNDCKGSGFGFEVCDPPGVFLGCGICQRVPNPCSDDTECKSMGADYICQTVVCACSFDQKQCQPGCTSDSQCGEASVCTDYRCVAKPCTRNADCPTYFQCSGNSCARKTCTSDGDCGSGYCVSGPFQSGSRCYESLGMCTMPPA